MAPLIRNLGCVVRFMLRPFYSQNDLSVPINRSVGHRDGVDVLEKRKKDLFRLPTSERDPCTLQRACIFRVLCWPSAAAVTRKATYHVPYI
jgi:hypothetical protein